MMAGLACLFEALSIVYCLHYFYGQKVRFDCLSLGYVIADVVIMGMINVFHIKPVFSLLILPVIIVYCVMEFGTKIKALIINNILQAMLLTILQSSLMLVFSCVFKNHKLGNAEDALINCLVFVFVAFGLKKFHLKKVSDILQNNEKLIIASLAVGIITVMLFLINYKQNSRMIVINYVVLGISVLLIVMILVDIGKNKIKMKEAEAELRIHKLYEASFRELIDEIRARQHEFDNHINAIYSQHQIYKTYDTLVAAQRKYCNEIVEENQFNKLLSKGDSAIICFLNSKFSEMKRVGINVEYNVNIGNLECGMPIHKMIELLGNLLKNAMEASRNQKEPKIEVTMLENEKDIQIEVLNKNERIEEAKIKDFFKRGYSEKGDKRGYGLYNVKKICETYNAAIVCKNKEKDGENWILFGIVINKPL